jgi:hypothetical protein
MREIGCASERQRVRAPGRGSEWPGTGQFRQDRAPSP